MLIGMGVVFLFLFILVLYMKLVPILSRLKRSSKLATSGSIPEDNKVDTSQTISSGENQKMKLESLMGKISDRSGSQGSNNQGVSEVTVAAIAAAICTHTGKKPKQIVITSPTGSTQQINLWAAAGRQDIMITRDMSGQVGFQY